MNAIKTGERVVLTIWKYKCVCETCGNELEIQKPFDIIVISSKMMNGSFVCVSKDVFCCPTCETRINFMLISKTPEFEGELNES